MQTRTLGRTGLEVSPIGLGAAQIGMQGVPPDDANRLLNTMLDDGLRVIDTASYYGLSEELIGDSVAHRRGDFWLFTKCGDAEDIALPNFTLEKMQQEVERSLRRLKTDCVDLMQLHSCSKEELEKGEVIEFVQRLKQEGKTRFIGYSGDSDAALYAVECGAFDTLQTSVNVADQETIDRGILLTAQERGMGVISKRSVANAAWRPHPNELQDLDDYQERLLKLDYPFLRGDDVGGTVARHLRFTLAVPGVDVCLVGLRSEEHWKEDLRAAQAGPLPPEEYEAIRRRWQEVCQPDWKGKT